MQAAFKHHSHTFAFAYWLHYSNENDSSATRAFSESALLALALGAFRGTIRVLGIGMFMNHVVGQKARIHYSPAASSTCQAASSVQSASSAPVISPSARPLKVAALVDLLYTPQAGGHVKCWERFARAATLHPQTLDLTVHFLSTEEKVLPLSENVRLHLHPPRFSTQRLPFLSHVPDHTDLASYNPKLAESLRQSDLIHTTDGFFSFASTALKVSRKYGIPLVNSLHTDTPNYTRVYTAQTLERLVGRGWILGLLLNKLKIHERAERFMRRKLARHQQQSSAALVSNAADADALRKTHPQLPVSFLRRGVDTEFFAPQKRDRVWLQQKFGIAPDKTAILYVGRLSRGKNVMVVADALAQLTREGLPVHLLCAGQGDEKAAILERLGSSASCPGVVLGEDLAQCYASADILAMPSEIEIFCNVVQEALASGLPIVIAAGSGMDAMIGQNESGLRVPERTPEAWAVILKQLCLQTELRQSMGRSARTRAQTILLSWNDVLVQDLLPVWHSVVQRSTRGK